MIQRPIFHRVLFVLVTLSVLSCSTANVIDVWKDEAYTKKIEKLIIVGMFDNYDVRKIFENSTAEAFKAKNIEAIPSISFMPINQEFTKAAIDDAIKGQNANTVMLTRVTSIENVGKVNRPASGYPDYRFGTTFNFMAQEVYTVKPYIETQLVTLETQLFDVESGNLIWKLNSRSFVAEKTSKEVRDFYKMIISNLGKANLLP